MADTEFSLECEFRSNFSKHRITS